MGIKSFLFFLIFLIIPNIAYANDENGLGKIIVFITKIIIAIFNSYFFALIFIILGFICLIGNIYDSAKHGSPSNSVGFLGIGLILIGFIMMYSIVNQLGNTDYLFYGFKLLR